MTSGYYRAIFPFCGGGKKKKETTKKQRHFIAGNLVLTTGLKKGKKADVSSVSPSSKRAIYKCKPN